MFNFGHRGSFDNLESFLKRMQRAEFDRVLMQYAALGAFALSAATPVRTGLAASSWGSEIVHHGNGVTIYWTNDNIENGFHVAVMIQYGHGTGTGGYVQGRDYINPAMQPIFDRIADDLWKVVTSA